MQGLSNQTFCLFSAARVMQTVNFGSGPRRRNKESAPRFIPKNCPSISVLLGKNPLGVVTMLYSLQLRFNVRGFKPSELTVKLEERTLRVTAQHQEEGDLGEKASKNFDRKMDLPGWQNS